MELIDLVNSVITFYLKQLRWLTLLLGSLTDSHSTAVLSDPILCSTVAFCLLGNSDHVVVSVSIDFPSNSFIIQLMTILMLIGMVFVINREMFHGKMSLNILLLLLILSFVSGGPSLELMYISLMINIRSSLIYLCGFQLLLLLL